MSQINVFASPLPFSNKRIKAIAPVGSSVEDIVGQILPAHLHGSNVGAFVELNGYTVPRHYWKNIKPKPGTTVNVRVVPMGGGDKGPLGTILSIAVMVAAPYVGAAFGTSLGLGVLGNGVLTAGQTAFFNGLVQGAFGIVGNLLVSALAPPPKPSNLGSVNNPQESPTQFIEGAQNSISRYGRVPIVLGTRRMFPPQAALPFTETQGNDQYIRQLFTYGYGDRIIIKNPRIGETAMSEFNGITLRHRLQGDLHELDELYTDDVFQENFSVLLSSEDDYTVRTTQPDVDEAIIDLTFSQGLFKLNSKGKRISTSVQLELQYRLQGDSDNWSPGISDYYVFSARNISLEDVPTISGAAYTYRKDIAVMDSKTGVIDILEGGTVADAAGPFSLAVIPEGRLRLATISIRRAINNGTTEVLSISDDREASLFSSGIFDNAGDFLVTNTGTTINFAGGGLKSDPLNLTASQAETLRVSRRIQFPTKATYDVRIKRITADSTDDKIFDIVHLTALKSVIYQSPVNLEGINGTAAIFKGTDQLNGAVDQFNVDASNAILDYDPDTETWIDGVITDNPASLYRYVLQGGANAEPLPDAEIVIEDLEAWHIHCTEQGYSYNRVIDYDTSVDEILRDIAASGSASPAVVDGKRTIVIDKTGKDIVQIVTPRNSWGYSGEMTFPDMPHAFRVQFPNAAKGYVQDEIIVYDDGYSALNATKFEVLELQSCTNSTLAFKTARRHIASARLRPETHSFYMAVENLIALRGDRITLEHDVPIVGVGDGRVSEIFTDSGSPELITGFSLDDTVTIPTDSTYFFRVRLPDGSFLYKELITSIGSTKTFYFVDPFEIILSEDDEPLFDVGALGYVVEAGGELDLIITRIEPQEDLTARITAINYAPEIFTAESAEIPLFDSNITTPLEFTRPAAPILSEIQSDESVMLRNSDGSFTARAVITLVNPNPGDIIVEVKVRRSGDTQYSNANLLEAIPEKVIATGLEDGEYYDFAIYYRRVGGTMLSPPLLINNYLFIGASEDPEQVSGFKVNISEGVAFFEWTKNPDIDISHYIMKFSAVYSGAAWNTAQLLKEVINETRFATPFVGGTYLIKAVDILGNESENATAVITYDPGNIKNVVQIYNEAPAFLGAKTNTIVAGSDLILEDAMMTGYYYFQNTLDLGAVFESSLSSAIIANGDFVNDILDIEDMFDELDIFGSGSNDIFTMTDIFETEDVFGIGSDAWEVILQYRSTLDDPNNSPDDADWTAWTDFENGNLLFRAIQFRLVLISYADNVTPRVSQASVTIDMPDRIERGNDLSVPIGGVEITFDPAFKAPPAVVITIQDGDANDEIEYVSKDETGFEFKVWNTTSAAYVARTFDYVASGYGREN